MALFIRVGIAVKAIEITGLGYIPDHDRFFINGELKQVRGEIVRPPSVTKGIGWFYGPTIELRYTYHPIFLKLLQLLKKISIISLVI